MPYKDPDKNREATRRWYRKNREREAAKRRQWHEANRERGRILSREYYARNRQAVCERTKQWNQDHPEKVREYGLRHAHKRRAVETNLLGLDEWIAILQGDPCSYCGEPMKELDHIAPLSKDGIHSWDNLTAACVNCNRAKFTKPLLESLL